MIEEGEQRLAEALRGYFTWEDVDRLRGWQEEGGERIALPERSRMEWHRFVEDVARRIADLLPPREKDRETENTKRGAQ